jgi:hypothetical protein
MMDTQSAVVAWMSQFSLSSGRGIHDDGLLGMLGIAWVRLIRRGDVGLRFRGIIAQALRDNLKGWRRVPVYIFAFGLVQNCGT